MKNLLEVDGVILEFGAKRILQDVYLKCETGEITGLLGRNGTGKSSLFKILFGELTAQSQSVRINKNTLMGSNRAPKNIRYLPQHNFAPNFLTIKSLFSDFEVDFSDLTSSFPEFEKDYKSKLSDLSLGQRRIIELFVILTSSTKFCLLDEPFSQVMPIHIASIKQLILREKTNKGIIITDHLYEHITDICEHLYVISDGKTYLTNSTNDLATLGYTRRW